MRLFPFVITVVLAAAATAATKAEEPRSRFGLPEIGERAALFADPSSAIRLRSATVQRVVENGFRLHMTFPPSADVAKRTTRYEIDLAARTYRFTIVEEERAARGGQIGANNLGSGIECARKFVRVWSEDPPGIQLARTNASLGWSYDWSTHDPSPRRSGHGCWAVPETPFPLLTHWYTNYCYGTPAFDGFYFVEKSVTGAYYNYDFLQDSEITNIRHNISISAAAPTLTWHDATVEHWGEAAFLLTGYQTETMDTWDGTSTGGTIARDLWFDGWVSDWCGLDVEVCPNSPLLVDFTGSDFRLTGIDEGVKFDISANGNLVRVAWTRRGDDTAFLFRDLDGDGLAGHGGELFGDATMLPDGSRAANGFEALRALDDDRDGRVGPLDGHWSGLQLWVDADHDGICRPSEVAPAASRLAWISVDYAESSRRDAFGNALRFHSIAAGVTRMLKVYDVYLAVDRTPPVP